MFFYVYLDPQAISEAYEQGPEAVDAITNLLRDLSQNCLLADFEGYYVQNEIRDFLSTLLGDFEIVRLKSVLKQFVKRGLFAPCLKSGLDPDASRIKLALNQIESGDLDFVVLTIEGAENEKRDGIACWRKFGSTGFEEKRRFAAVYGTELPAGEVDESSFFEQHFRRPLRFASRIEIVDRQCGEKYKDNYEYSIERFLKWLEATNRESPKIVFHLGFPSVRESTVVSDADLFGIEADRIESVKQAKLLAAIKKHAPTANIVVKCYEETLPHQRYIVTDQVAFSVDVGMDFLNPTSRNNRKLSLSIKPGDKVLSELQ